MNKVYMANHHPRINYLCDIREMVMKELPDELYHLDVLDGSPPCSSFSMAGVHGGREKGWGKEK
jgi:DNA (cytosine-5)-methyltransferase 1